MNWWEGRLLAYDCETTGLDVEEARIVTATLAHVGGGEPAQTIGLIVNPGVEIPAEATAVHGITTATAQEEGEDPIEALCTISQSITMATEADVPLVAYNARYDLTVLDRECRRNGVEFPLLGAVIDGLVLDKHLDPYRKGSRRLEAVCEHYRCRLDGAHDSAHDALAAARVAYRIGQTTELGHMTAPGLHDAQIGWAASQARSLRDYFMGRNETEKAASVRDEWPVVPAP